MCICTLCLRSRPDIRGNQAEILAWLPRHPVRLDEITETLRHLFCIYKIKSNLCRGGCMLTIRVLEVNQVMFAVCFETSVARYCARFAFFVVVDG